jgi:putative NADH-flavin reductase
MKLAVFGGTGRTGIHVVRKALAAGHEVTALARTPDKMGIQDAKLTVVQGDVTDRAAVDKTVAGADAVISALAPTVAGMQNIVAAMKAAGITRIVVTSGAGVYRPGDNPPMASKIISFIIKTFSGDAYNASVGVADVLDKSGLEWTLVRAPRLVDEPARGNLYVGPLNSSMKTTLTREDYGQFLLDQLNDRSWIQKSPVISDK